MPYCTLLSHSATLLADCAVFGIVSSPHTKALADIGESLVLFLILIICEPGLIERHLHTSWRQYY